jgi:uncharacterized membrane protein
VTASEGADRLDGDERRRGRDARATVRWRLRRKDSHLTLQIFVPYTPYFSTDLIKLTTVQSLISNKNRNWNGGVL